MTEEGNFALDQWAVILGGSSGFGLATAQKLSEHGMNLCVVHRDRRAVLKTVEPEFEKIRGSGVKLITFNLDALAAEKRAVVLEELTAAMGAEGRVRVLLHSIAFGNLKLLVPEKKPSRTLVEQLALRVGVDAAKLQDAATGGARAAEQTLRVVTAEYPEQVWHVDLTVVPTGPGLWAPWIPFALPQV